MRVLILASLLSGCSFISDTEHSKRVAEARALADTDDHGEIDEDADGTGPVDDTGSTPPDSDDTGSTPPDSDDTGSTPPDSDDTGTPLTDIDEDGDGFSEIDGDCADTDPSIFPGAVEHCDYIDNDCDGEVDEDGFSIWYRDGDGDHWGDESIPVSSCSPGDGWATVPGDCDDDDATTHPGAEEVCDFVDNNCDGETDEGVEPATYFEDSDGDGHGTAGTTMESCVLPDGYALVGDDCDDTVDTTHPGAEEVCDGVDNNCDGETDEGVTPEIYYLDADSDGHGNPLVSLESCTPVGGYTTLGDDCDDSAVAIHPEALEVCNGVDDDCDLLVDDDDDSTHVETMSTFYDDDDGDDYGDPATSSLACEPPTGTVSDNTDCDDEVFTTHPGALEYCNSVDDDCNDIVDDDAVDAFTWYEDADDDTFGNPAVTLENCRMPIGYVADNTDCDDHAFTTHPGAPEIGYDGEDNDCNDLLDDMSIADEALWSVTGTVAAPELGSEGVTSAGDVNGNGIDDLLISVPLHDATGRANCGAIAFFDSAAGVGIVSYKDAYLLVEGNLNAKSGRSIVIGNVDDDLAPELAHAGPGAAGGGARRGEVWIYDVNGLEGEQVAQSIREGRIRGHHTDHANGTDLAAGDFSGDGLIELIIGAPGGTDRAGDASIYEESDGYMDSNLDHSDSTLEMGGEEDGDRFGSVIENVGDVTGDGIDDIVVCAPQHLGTWGEARGTCWLFTHPVSLAAGDDKLDATEVAWASFSHDVSTDEFGQHPDSIAGGDFLGTSTNEIAFGLPGANTVLIYEDASGGGSFAPADAAASITGSGRLGRSLSGSTDLDGDGADDLLLGAPTTSLGSLYFLPNDSIIGDLVVPGAESASWHGSWIGDAAGFALSGLGDFDEDGTDEFAVAAPKSDHAAADAGQVWIIPAY